MRAVTIRLMDDILAVFIGGQRLYQEIQYKCVHLQNRVVVKYKCGSFTE